MKAVQKIQSITPRLNNKLEDAAMIAHILRTLAERRELSVK